MSTSSKQLPIITFNSLYNVLKEEERNPILNSLPEHFYEGVEEFMKSKEEELKTNSTDVKLQHKIKTATKIYSKLQKLRAKKIAQIGIDGIEYDEDALLAIEVEYLKNIKKAFNQTYTK